jgi:5,5'-dehydrodivanillate O-demethylase
MDFEEFVHTGPGTLAGCYLRSFWQPICCAYELRTGQALPVKILGEQFTVYRGAQANLQLLQQYRQLFRQRPCAVRASTAP